MLQATLDPPASTWGWAYSSVQHTRSECWVLIAGEYRLLGLSYRVALEPQRLRRKDLGSNVTPTTESLNLLGFSSSSDVPGQDALSTCIGGWCPA